MRGYCQEHSPVSACKFTGDNYQKPPAVFRVILVIPVCRPLPGNEVAWIPFFYDPKANEDDSACYPCVPHEIYCIHNMTRFLFRYIPLILLASLSWPAAAEIGGLIPQNASTSSHGKGWECDQGYRAASNGGCAPTGIPAHAYVTNSTYGRGNVSVVTRRFMMSASSLTYRNMPT